MSLMDCTAAELADMLDAMDRYPHSTGSLSMLDEATISFGRVSADLQARQCALSHARYAHMRSYRTETGNYSAEAWHRAMIAAHSLADALRELGDMRVARCKRPARHGTCDLPLDENGGCTSSLGHTDGQ